MTTSLFNQRQIGGSRIRAPAKDGWKRDVVRVKGGVTDYCVIGEIDMQALRRFQTSYCSPAAAPFNLAPDGFDAEHRRETLTAGYSIRSDSQHGLPRIFPSGTEFGE